MKKSTIAGVCLAVFVGLCVIVLVNGFSVENHCYLDGAAAKNIDAGVSMSLWADACKRSVGILGVSIYSMSRGPYSLRFGFYTNTASADLTSVTLENVALQYSDGTSIEVVTSSRKRTWGFSAHRYSNWTSNRIVYHDLWQAGGTLTNCVHRNEAFVVECQGELRRSAGETIPFNVQWAFRPRRVSGVFSGWHFERPFEPP